MLFDCPLRLAAGHCEYQHIRGSTIGRQSVQGYLTWTQRCQALRYYWHGSEKYNDESKRTTLRSGAKKCRDVPTSLFLLLIRWSAFGLALITAVFLRLMIASPERVNVKRGASRKGNKTRQSLSNARNNNSRQHDAEPRQETEEDTALTTGPLQPFARREGVSQFPS